MNGTKANGGLARDSKSPGDPFFHVVALDFGVKRNILRKLAQRHCKVTVLPAQTSADEILALQSRRSISFEWPWRSRALRLCHYCHPEIASRKKCPFSASAWATSCWGWPVGGRTIKMKFGHHGANHPVQDMDSGKVLITSQNHGFAVDIDSLPSECEDYASVVI